VPERRRVLVVDDDRVVQQAMRELLEGWGYEVAVAGSQAEAMARASGFLPDLLVVDYRLPNEANGADAIEALHAQAGRPIPAVVITGDTVPDRLKEATARGYPLLHKPAQPAKLRTTLRNLAAAGGRQADAIRR
jgi:CheY-like chemotaxis protein